MDLEVVCDGIRFGEGPVWCGGGVLVVTSVVDGVVYRVRVDTGRVELLADVGGGANGAALAVDGSVIVTQNGGIDFTPLHLFDDPPPVRRATPGIQRVAPDGAVRYLADRDLHAPNDLAVAPDGRLVFTDPGHHPPPDPPIGRVMALASDGSVDTVATGFHFCNGIAFDPDGTLVVVERLGLLALGPDGRREWVIEVLGPGGGDGFCLDADGRYYVASTIEHGIRIVDRDGTILDFLPIRGAGLTTNCCFGGDDGRTLFATDAIPGRVVAWQHMPTPGLPLPRWSPGPTRPDALGA